MMNFASGLRVFQVGPAKYLLLLLLLCNSSASAQINKGIDSVRIDFLPEKVNYGPWREPNSFPSHLVSCSVTIKKGEDRYNELIKALDDENLKLACDCHPPKALIIIYYSGRIEKYIMTTRGRLKKDNCMALKNNKLKKLVKRLYRAACDGEGVIPKYGQ